MALASAKQQSVLIPGNQLYLDLLKKCLLNTIYEDSPMPMSFKGEPQANFELDKRLAGKDWPSKAHTMIGLPRLDNIQALAEDVLGSDIQGDFLEAGVWRGGATIFMRAILKAYGIENRKVWVADSFQGFPDPKDVSPRSYSSPSVRNFFKLAADKKLFGTTLELLKEGTQLEEVKDTFERYDLLDVQVEFLPGWFSETLSRAPISKLAILRMDGDLYDSTFQILENLYPKVSAGGYVIVDDYHSFAECQQAVHDYLDAKGITVHLVPIDEEAVFWKKER